MATTLTPTYIFNQYYIDLLKKLKNIAKKHKTQSETAKKILKTIKDNYQTYDKSSDEYISYFKLQCNDDFWNSYISLEKDKCDEWLNEENNQSVEIYKNITLKDILKLLRNNFITHHYLSVLYIYTNDLNEDEITKILKILQSVSEDEEFDISNENIKKILVRLNELKSETIKGGDGEIPGMDTLKDTTIGKIAKEIIEGVDLSKIKQSITEEGDIFKAIAKPDSGFGELFTNVSQKMSSKISSGELSQEAILNDAMKFASILPGLFGNKGGNSNGDNSGGFDMSSMANMMQMMQMMNSGGGMGGGMGGGGKKQRTSVNSQGMKNLMKRQQLKQKLNNT